MYAITKQVLFSLWGFDMSYIRHDNLLMMGVTTCIFSRYTFKETFDVLSFDSQDICVSILPRKMNNKIRWQTKKNKFFSIDLF